MSEKMQALVVTRPGGPEVLEVREVDCPRLRDELDVLVQVKAAGINPADWQNRKNGAVYDSDGGPRKNLRSSELTASAWWWKPDER